MTTKTELLAFINEQESFWKPSSPVIKNVKKYLNMITNHSDLTGNELKQLLSYFSERLQKHHVNNLENLKNFSDSGTLNTLKQLLEKFYPNMDLIYMYNNELLNDENWQCIQDFHSQPLIKIKMAQWIIELYRDYGIDVSKKNAFSIVVKDEIVNYALKIARLSSSNDVSVLTILATSVKSSRLFKENNLNELNKDIIIPIFFLHKNQCLTKKYFNFIQRLKRNASSNPNDLLFFAEWLVKFNLSDIVVTDEILFNIQVVLSMKSGKYSSIFYDRENNCSLFSWMFKMDILSLKNLELLFAFPLQLNPFNLFMTETAREIFAQESSSYDAQQMFDFMIENAANYHPEREMSQSSKDMLDFKEAVFDGKLLGFKLFNCDFKEEERRMKILLACNNLTEKWLEENDMVYEFTCENIKRCLAAELTEMEWEVISSLSSPLLTPFSDIESENESNETSADSHALIQTKLIDAICMLKRTKISITSSNELLEFFELGAMNILIKEPSTQALVCFMHRNKILSKENIEILSVYSLSTQNPFDFLSTKSVKVFLSRTTEDAQILFELMLGLSQESEFDRKFERYLFASSVCKKVILEHCAMQDIPISNEEMDKITIGILESKTVNLTLEELLVKFSAFHEQFQAKNEQAEPRNSSFGRSSLLFFRDAVTTVAVDVVEQVANNTYSINK